MMNITREIFSYFPIEYRLCKAVRCRNMRACSNTRPHIRKWNNMRLGYSTNVRHCDIAFYCFIFYPQLDYSLFISSLNEILSRALCALLTAKASMATQKQTCVLSSRTSVPISPWMCQRPQKSACTKANSSSPSPPPSCVPQPFPFH